MVSDNNTVNLEEYYMLFHISSKFDFFIGVDMVMCHALILVKESELQARGCRNQYY
jgi:hypothetical protein